MKPKILIIGIDGGTFEVIRPLVQKGELKNIAKLMEDGAFGNLQSVIPPLTATAWPSFLTGLTPDNHGVFDFLKIDNHGRRFVCNSTSIRGETLYSIFNRNDMKVCSVGVPMTFPPPKVDGWFVSGFPETDKSGDIAYPPQLKSEIEELVGYYETEAKLANANFEDEQGDSPQWEKYDFLLSQLYWQIEKQHRIALHLIKTKPWDAFFTVYSLTDRIQHFFWKFYDKTHPDFTEEGCRRFGHAVFDSYRKTDEMIGDLLENIDDNTSILILSDHGFGRYVGDLNISKILLDHGFLKLKTKEITHKIPVTTQRILEKIKVSAINKLLPEKLRNSVVYHGEFVQTVPINQIDWANTTLYPYIWGVRINLKGREKHGIVELENQKKILEKFANVIRDIRDPRFDELKHYIRIIYREDFYKGKFAHDAADLYIAFSNEKGLYLVRQGNAQENLFTCARGGRSGTHKFNGMFILKNPNVQKGTQLANLNIIDVAPTLLYLTGLKIPEMDGKIISQGITDEFLKSNEPAHEIAQSVANNLNQQEEEEIMKTLRALGYTEYD